MSGIKLNSRNHKPQLYSEMANKSKEDAWMEEEERKEKARLELLEKQKADADKLKTIADAINSFSTMLTGIEMSSSKGNDAKRWLQERLVKACANSEIMYHKLKNQE